MAKSWGGWRKDHEEDHALAGRNEEQTHEVWDDVRKKVLKNLPCFECMGRGWVKDHVLRMFPTDVATMTDCPRCGGVGLE